MHICPECEAEYEEGIATCTDCAVPLVDELPPREPPDTADGEPVALRNFSNAAEASMVESLLAENGIRVFVSGGDFTVAPSMFSGEIVLMVDERDIDRASALYEAYFGESAEPAGAPESAPTEPTEDDGEGRQP